MDKRMIGRPSNGPLTGRTVVVYGAGPLGLMTTLVLARNGADVVLVSNVAISHGIGFVNAAGLFEPVASADPRQTDWLASGLEFAQWAKTDPAWGVEPRRVLFLSDEAALVEQDWMLALDGYRLADDRELAGRRRFGAWFETVVLQPDIALHAFERELTSLGVRRAHNMQVPSVEQAARMARTMGADFFVLALGLGLAGLLDIERVAGSNAGLSAGLGLTIRLPIEPVGLDHVLMDADDLGYLIPQRTMVIGGGTNLLLPFDDPLATGVQPLSRIPELEEEWFRVVRAKMTRLWPAVRDVVGESRVGARPLRSEVLTMFTQHFGVEGVLIGGAGGSGWTFSHGIAEDTTRLIVRRMGGSEALRIIDDDDDEGTMSSMVDDPDPEPDPV